MLILSRRVGETIMIGDEVTVTVLSIRGGQARLGIGAPKKVTVHREEIYVKAQERRRAESLPPRLDSEGPAGAAA